MAPKRPDPKEDPPAPSSSEEEEQEDEGNSSTDEDDDRASSGVELPTQRMTLVPHSQGQPKKLAVQDSDSDSDTDSDSGPPPKSSGVLHNVKPIASKPKPKELAAPASSSKSAAATKRGSETDREGKRRKEVAEGGDEDGKNEDAPRVLFQRLWGESDEIAVLSGLIEFSEKRGADPLKDMAGFYDFVKKSLAVDVSLAQLKEKVARLRKKFKNHAKGKSGLDKSFSKAHDQKSFDLSKKIWDSEGEVLVDQAGKLNGKAKKSGGSSSKSRGAEDGYGKAKSIGGTSNAEKMEIDEQKGVFSLDCSLTSAEVEGFVVKKGLEMVEGSERMELGRRWKELNIATLELFVQRKELITDQARSILDSRGS